MCTICSSFRSMLRLLLLLLLLDTISFFDAPRMCIRSSLIILTTFDRDVVILRLNRAVSVSPQSLVLG